MGNLRNMDILIYRSDDVHVELIDSRVEGDLNKVIWAEFEKVAFALCNIILNIGCKSEAVPYISIQKKNTARIGMRITAFFDPENINVEEIQLLVTNFLNEICKKDKLSGELFSQPPSAHDEVIRKEAINFLTKNGNKHIKHPLEVSSGNSLIRMDGKFGQTPNRDQILNDPSETHVGIVDGLVRHSRTVYLKLAISKIVAAYFDENDFPELHRLMLSEEPYRFEIQQKYDAGGKKDTYLNSFEKNEEELLDFSF
ncbi:MAG TPA: hypothetical protein PK056_08125 [Methylotenera sp.]|nr:hypothetical protein [Methylotenera sp.]